MIYTMVNKVEINYDNILELLLEQLMLRYNADTKQEALKACARDLVRNMAEEAESQGKSKEEFEFALEQEVKRFELKRLKDTEASACYHKILRMLNEQD